jgi:hypothetical protein
MTMAVIRRRDDGWSLIAIVSPDFVPHMHERHFFTENHFGLADY